MILFLSSGAWRFPNQKMAEMAGKIQEIADKDNIVMTAYGHFGSECMHTKILMDTKRKEFKHPEKTIYFLPEFLNLFLEFYPHWIWAVPAEIQSQWVICI